MAGAEQFDRKRFGDRPYRIIYSSRDGQQERPTDTRQPLDRNAVLIEEANKKLTSLEKVASNLEEKLNTLEHGTNVKLEKFDDRLKGDKFQTIQMLAIFVAFFTFVSVQFQLFSSLKDSLSVLALSMLLLGSLLVFVSLTLRGLDGDKSLRKKMSWHSKLWGGLSQNWFLLIAVVLFLLGVGSYSLVRYDSNRKSDNHMSLCGNIEERLLDPRTIQESKEFAAQLQELHKSSGCDSM